MDFLFQSYLGLPTFAYGGVALGLLVIFQVMIGSRIIKVNFKVHRIMGYLILAGAVFHGIVATLFLYQ